MSAYDDWVTSFCSEFRQRCEHLQITADAAQPRHMPTLFAPCQIYILGSTDPTFQFLLITHNESRADMERVVQVDVPAYEFIDVLEAFKEREEFRISPRGSFSLHLKGRTPWAPFWSGGSPIFSLNGGPRLLGLGLAAQCRM